MTELRTASVKGRDIQVKALNDGQMALFAREAHVVKSERQEMNRRWDAIARMMDILESVVVDADDKEFLLGLSVNGELSLGDMISIAVPDNKVEAAAVKPVRRARQRR